MKKLKLNINEIKVDSFEMPKTLLKTKGTANGFDKKNDPNRNEATGGGTCIWTGWCSPCGGYSNDGVGC